MKNKLVATLLDFRSVLLSFMLFFNFNFSSSQVVFKLNLESCPNCNAAIYQLAQSKAIKAVHVVIKQILQQDSADIVERYDLNKSIFKVQFNDSQYRAISKHESSEIIIFDHGRVFYRNTLNKFDGSQIDSILNTIAKDFEYCLPDHRISQSSFLWYDNGDIISENSADVFYIISPRKNQVIKLKMDDSMQQFCYKQLSIDQAKYDSLNQLIKSFPNTKPYISHVKKVDSVIYQLTVRLFNYRYQNFNGSIIKRIGSKPYLLKFNCQTKAYYDLEDLENIFDDKYFINDKFSINQKGDIVLSASKKSDAGKSTIFFYSPHASANKLYETKIQMPAKSEIVSEQDGAQNVEFCNNLMWYWFADTVYNLNTLTAEFVIPWQQIERYESESKHIAVPIRQVVSAMSSKEDHAIVYILNNKYYLVKFNKNNILEFYPLDLNYACYNFSDFQYLNAFDLRSGCIKMFRY